jgi:hypothetical protein
MTPAQILTSIRAQFNEPTPNFITDSEIYQYLWEAETTINNLTECNEATDATINTIIGTAEYSLPSTVLFVKRVLWDYVRLKKIDFRELENQEGQSYGNPVASAQPYAYYLYGPSIGFYPTPNLVKNVKMWVITQPVLCTSGSTAFTIPQLFHHLFADYCLYRMFSKDQEDNRTAFYKAKWDEALAQAVRSWNQSKSSDKIYMVKDADRYPNVYPGMI